MTPVLLHASPPLHGSRCSCSSPAQKATASRMQLQRAWPPQDAFHSTTADACVAITHECRSRVEASPRQASVGGGLHCRPRQHDLMCSPQERGFLTYRCTQYTPDTFDSPSQRARSGRRERRAVHSAAALGNARHTHPPACQNHDSSKPSRQAAPACCAGRARQGEGGIEIIVADRLQMCCAHQAPCTTPGPPSGTLISNPRYTPIDKPRIRHHDRPGVPNAQHVAKR